MKLIIQPDDGVTPLETTSTKKKTCTGRIRVRITGWEVVSVE